VQDLVPSRYCGRVTDVRIIIPCYNEARRLPVDEIDRFLDGHAEIDLVLVNDGSTDATLQALVDLEARRSGRVRVVDQQPNQGKAEAVRRGMLLAIDDGADYAGYWDADLATPLEEIPRFVTLLETRPDLRLVMGSRVRLLGRMIERGAARHYLGRVYATVASMTLRMPVYDTQCGAKLFRCDERVRRVFADRFIANWTFDVELIARFVRDEGGASDRVARTIREVPLSVWRDVAGSKVRAADFFRGIVELFRIKRRYLS